MAVASATERVTARGPWLGAMQRLQRGGALRAPRPAPRASRLKSIMELDLLSGRSLPYRLSQIVGKQSLWMSVVLDISICNTKGFPSSNFTHKLF
jgi:hypothetical protein